MSSVATSFIISLKGKDTLLPRTTSRISLHFQKNQDHVTSLPFFPKRLLPPPTTKELEHHVYPMVAGDLQEAYPNIPASYLQHLL